MTDGFFGKGFEENWRREKLRMMFGMLDGTEGKAEVLMADAIEAMHEAANMLTDHEEPPIPMEARREACLRLCGETFDRLQKETADEREWRLKRRPNKT